MNNSLLQYLQQTYSTALEIFACSSLFNTKDIDKFLLHHIFNIPADLAGFFITWMLTA